MFRKATYFTRKNDYLKTTNESEPMGLGRTSTSGYRDENVFYVYCLKHNQRKNFISLLFDADSLRLYVCGELMFRKRSFWIKKNKKNIKKAVLCLDIVYSKNCTLFDKNVKNAY